MHCTACCLSLSRSLHSGSLIHFDSLCVLSDNVRLTCTPIYIFPFTPCTEEHMFDESIHLFTKKRINCYTLCHEFDEDRRFEWCGILQQAHGQTMIWMLVNRKHRNYLWIIYTLLFHENLALSLARSLASLHLKHQTISHYHKCNRNAVLDRPRQSSTYSTYSLSGAMKTENKHNNRICTPLSPLLMIISDNAEMCIRNDSQAHIRSSFATH